MNEEMSKNIIMEDEDEIDIFQLLFKIKTQWYIVVIGLLLGCIVGVLYNTFMITPMYSSSTMIYMRTGNKTISVSDLSLSESLNSDYQVIFTSRPNLESVIEDLNLDYTPSQLASYISVSALDDTRIIKITATNEDPYLAKDIANSLATYGVEMVKEVDSQAPYVIETAIASTSSISDSLIKTTGICGAVGAVLGAGIIVLFFFLNDTIESADDLEKNFHLPVLSIVTEDKMYDYSKRSLLDSSSDKKKHHKHKHHKKKK